MKTQQSTNLNLAIHTILQLVWEHESITRAQLSRISGFSRSTITLNVDRLLAQGLLLEGRINNKQSRTNLMINQDRGIFIGVEMDADCCEVGSTTIGGSLINSERFAIDFDGGPDFILSQIESCITKLCSMSQRKVLGIGVGLPTPVDYEKGHAVHPAFMPGWHHYPIKTNLADVFHCPVFVDNEVNTMAYGEVYLNQKLRSSDVLFIKLGMGIGSGLIVGGKIYRGNSGMSGNIGHMRYDAYTEKCSCGKQGCLEAIAGGTALLTKARELAQLAHNSKSQNVNEDQGYLTIQNLVDAVKQGEQSIVALVEERATIVGSMVGRMVLFFDPKTVILGGDLCNLGPHYIDCIKNAIITEATPWIMGDFDISVSKFTESIGVIGSAMLAIREVLENGLLLD